MDAKKFRDVDEFLECLQAGEAEQCLEILNSGRVEVIAVGHLEATQKQLREQTEEIVELKQELQKYRSALQEVKQERDTLLSGVYHIYQTFSFVFRSIEENQQSAETNKQAGFLAKALGMLGLKTVSPAAIGVIQSVVNHLRKNMDSLTQNVEQLGERLQPSLAILIKYEIISPAKPSIESPEKAPTNG